MNILVLNGSPKGENSVTLQTVKYLEMKFPQHAFEVLHVGQKIKALEKDFSAAKEALERAELILFCYPVYTFIAPCQLHSFIALMKACGADLSGKFASQISTSKHFYDMTAHEYIRENAQDMGMKYVRGLSADMDDLLSEKGRADASAFFEHLVFCAQNGLYEPFARKESAFVPAQTTAAEGVVKREGDVLILTDSPNERLQAMIDRFTSRCPVNVRLIDIGQYPFRGGCLGCFHCAVSGKCVYKDGFDEYLRSTIQTAQAIVYAFTVRDHSMGARFKMYDDRNFCNGHRTVTMGMPIGYLVDGALSREANLRTIIEARAQVGSNFLAGIAGNETEPDREIDMLAAQIGYALEKKYVPPQNFYGIGGMKVFRDLIWVMQGMMKADHKFYKAHGQYDFPQKQWPRMLSMYLVGMLISNPKLMAKAGSAMTDGMLAPYRKALEKAKTE